MNRQNAKAPNREPDKELEDLARLRRRSGGYGAAKARRVIGAAIEVHKAQVISDLKATGHLPGLLINFNEVVLPDGLRRIILSE